ncbi:fibroblast growth factor-binding protein 1 [Myripristis murdjan]|uniref:Fibroblast growth factor binding protein 1a n=1 Tax=Myripristis murdjan TaxID=586833 RepID=A0A667Z4F1_9TELE|nr:fibroblast growth factor-binding protein 1 [Myripristis murdjan]
MALLTNFTVLLVLACISQQLVMSSSQKGTGRKGRADRKDRDSRGRQPHPVMPLPVKGKLVAKDKSQCTWVATGEDLFTLGVNCRKGDKSFSCEYTAKPNACPLYASSAELYWKQIARALRKQRKLCQDSDALIRAGMCRKSPRDAHFRLSSAPPSPLGLAAVKSCKPVNQKLAEEYCSNSWTSVCTFFFSIVQNGDC